jgi:glycosyltransferase involved in cell wall biosynthesis
MISILIPIFNGIEFINDSVESVLSQSFKEWELLIGINGHSQNSDIFQTAKKYEKKDIRIKVYDFYNIKGKSNTLNLMAKYCKYNYISLLDVDDIWHFKKLEIQSKFLSYYDVVGSNCIWFGDINGIVPKIPLLDISSEDFAKVNPIINSSSIIKRDLCYWNPKLDGIEDYDLWLRLRKQKRSFFNCPEILVKHRIHKTSAFNTKGNEDKVIPLLISHGFRVKDKNITYIKELNNIQKINMNIGKN